MAAQATSATLRVSVFDAETKGMTSPLWTVPGNYDHFGIIPTRSYVPATHPLYDRGMYRLYRGPDYYSSERELEARPQAMSLLTYVVSGIY